MNASSDTRPDLMIGVMMVDPLPLMMLTTPGGKQSRKASSSGTLSSEPNRGSFEMIGLPISTAGMSVAKVSLRG